ncbi:MAG: T9SS type A sorting domain-containing protein [Ignavibacteria bacterium]|nr:T9SS type A sorting domain-containing protein [Ignavibacteria bacterium]
MITGTTMISGHGYSIFVMKINALGDTIWTRTVPNAPNENDNATVISATTDGGVVIAGQNDTAWTCKFDITGNLIWYKKYLLFSRFSEDIINTDDNGFLFCGFVNYLPGAAFVFKVDFEGNLLWDKVFSSQFLKVFYSVTQHDDGFILTGFKSESIGSPNEMIIFCINPNGDSLWQKSYYFNNRSSSGRKIIKLNNDYFIGSGTVDSSKGQIAFMKIDSNGDSIFTHRFPVNGRNNYFNSFAIANNKLIFSYARDSSFGLANSYGLITDLNGNMIKQKVFTNSSFVWGSLRAIVPIANGDILFAGTGQLQPSTRVIYAVRTDSLLNTSEYIGVEQTSSNVPKSFYLFNNYPNPFNSSTNIEFQLSKSAFIVLQIFDINGKLVDVLKNEYLNTGRYKTQWYANNYSSGVYFVKITSAFKEIYSIKMLLIK